MVYCGDGLQDKNGVLMVILESVVKAIKSFRPRSAAGFNETQSFIIKRL